MVTQDGVITIDGLEEVQQKLQQLRTDSPGFERRLRGVIKNVLGHARAALSKDAQAGLRMDSDPRNAYKAVRHSVYKRIFGGQVNILQPRRSSGRTTNYEPSHKGLPSRGGNRRARSERTKSIDSKEGSERGFILRFLNAGTDVRYAGYGRNGRTDAQKQMFIQHHDGRGNRGRIAPRNWFGNASQRELEKAAEQLQTLIDRIIKDEFV